MNRLTLRLSIALLLLTFALGVPAVPPDSAGETYDESLYAAMQWRQVGPFRGGRSAACAGIPSDRNTYYFGAAGGGVWKTKDAGRSWKNVSDGSFGGSIGAVAVSEWDPNVVYVGGGEVTVRGNVSHGDGMWKSTDAGKTWKSIGLKDSRRIPRIRIHPKNPDLVYAAVLGHLFGANEERGVYRSKDGGESWEKILFVSDKAGAVDLCMDPTNPRILYASIWQVKRTPYSLESGGADCGMWKSTDGGDTWKDISRNPGLPKGTLGISGISVSKADPERVYAIVEAEEGGVFVSDNAGKTWRRTSADRNLRQRAWYYSRIYADPIKKDVVYVLNVRFHRSDDGGKTFKTIRTPHVDNHDLWIDPDDNQRMIEANDGGANVSFDGGASWSAQDNQPTAQFYRVTTDNSFPYRIYGAQQDNSTVRILHTSRGSERDWESTAGGESGHIAPHPENPDIVYGGSYDGYLTRYDHRTKQSRVVTVWPNNPMGHGAAGLKYRFQWNFPIFFSPHDSRTLYTAGNVLFKTLDEGRSWKPISPDLTRNDKSRQGSSGGPITKDNTSVEYYCTIFAAAESHKEKGVIWCGSDDGLIHVTKDGGKNWRNVTPGDMPEWMQINSIEIHPTKKGALYVAGTRYKSDDFRPYLYKTTDYGETWTKITDGIAEDHFTRVVRADPDREGLLFAGTERGVYLSFDDGENWKPFQLNLPVVPITDLAIKNGDLVAATQGRSFWVMDDLSPLHELSPEMERKPFHLYTPRPTYRMGGRAGGGVALQFVLKTTKKSKVKLEVLDSGGKKIKSFQGKKLKLKKGMNRVRWNMRYPDARGFEGLIMWAGGLSGPKAAPGTYKARLTVNGKSETVRFEIAPDPRAEAKPEDYKAQFDFLIKVRDKLTETHEAIIRIRELRDQVSQLKKRLKGRKDLKDLLKSGDDLVEKVTKIEEALYQTKNRSGQDPLNFPIRLNNKLAALSGVVGRGNYAPTVQAEELRKELTGKIDEKLDALKAILKKDLPAFNAEMREKKIPGIILPSKGKKKTNETEASGDDK